MKLGTLLTSRKAVITYVVLSGLFIILIVMDTLVMPGLVHIRGEMVIPNVVNLRVEEAMETLENAGVRAVIADTVPTSRSKSGTIAAQNPPGGTVVRQGRNVYLSVSGGEGNVKTPSLRGRSLRDATLALEQAGLHPGMVTYETSNLPPETVVSQSIPAGEVTHRNAIVDIVISTGQDKNQFGVPSLLHFTVEEAQNFMRESKLRIGEITYRRSPENRAGTIIEQTPAAGEMADMNTAINIVVAK